MNPLDSLSSDARRLLDAARDAPAAPDVVKARVLASVSTQAVAGASLSVVGKALVLLTVVTGGVFLALAPQSKNPAEPAPAQPAPVAVAPQAAAEPALAVAPAVAPEEKAAPKPVPRATQAPAVIAVPSCDLPAELSALQHAQAQLGADPERALAGLNSYESTCPALGALAPERLAVRALALCAVGKSAEGLIALSALEKLAPESPLLPRTRAGCLRPERTP